MRSPFRSVLFLLLLFANHTFAQGIPEVVDKFQDTRALYSSLQNMQLLLSRFQVKNLRGFSVDPWHAFLKSRGDDIVSQEWRNIRVPGKSYGRVVKLKEFVNDPASQDNFLTTDPATKQIATRLVEEYAKFQNANDHIAAVNDHLRGPNDAAHLLID